MHFLTMLHYIFILASMSVKDVLQSLVDDAMVDTERIGTSNYFWAYPSKALHGVSYYMQYISYSALQSLTITLGSEGGGEGEVSISRSIVRMNSHEDRTQMLLPIFAHGRKPLKPHYHRPIR